MSIVYDLIDYLLDDSEFADAVNYDGSGYKPFFPAQEQPESEQPFIRYSMRTTVDTDEWWIQTDDWMLFIHSNSPLELNNINAILIDRLVRGDKSAKPINKWMLDNGREDYWVHSTEVQMLGQYVPSEQEGGEFQIPTTIRIKYTRRNGTGLQ